MTRYIVFMDAPKRGIDGPYRWETASSLSAIASTSKAVATPFAASQSIVLVNAADYEAASQRISRIYADTVFQDDREECEEDLYANELNATDDNSGSVEQSLRGENSRSRFALDQTAPSFSVNQTTIRTVDSQDASNSVETQDTASYGGGESIANLPAFSFSLRSLTSLAALASPVAANRYDEPGRLTTRKVNVLLAVLEIEGPDSINIKKGPNAGTTTSLLKMVLGDEEGDVCKLAAWRETAESWTDVKKGDVVFVENAQALTEGKTAPSLTASPWLKSKLTICYRTLPYTHEDTRYRPDLRLAATDPALAKVGRVVRWIESECLKG